MAHVAYFSGLILGLRPANERRRYLVHIYLAKTLSKYNYFFQGNSSDNVRRLQNVGRFFQDWMSVMSSPF